MTELWFESVGDDDVCSRSSAESLSELGNREDHGLRKLSLAFEVGPPAKPFDRTLSCLRVILIS